MRNVDIWKEAHIVGPMAEFIRENRLNPGPSCPRLPHCSLFHTYITVIKPGLDNT